MVTVREPGRRLVLTWHRDHSDDEEPLEVCVTVTASGLGTRVKVTHADLSPTAGAPGWGAGLLSLAVQAVHA